MVRRITKEDFERFLFENDGDVLDNPTLDSVLSQSLSRLMAWNELKSGFDLLTIDSAGKLNVSSESSKADTCVSSNPTVTTVTSNIVNSNADRRTVIIQNVGGTPCYINFGEDATLTDGMLLEAGSTYIDDVWVGRIAAIVSVGTTTLHIQEMS